jgi:hypothetical protein
VLVATDTAALAERVGNEELDEAVEQVEAAEECLPAEHRGDA